VILMAVIGIWYGLEATGIPDALLEPDQEPAALTEAALSSEPLPLGTLVARAQAARPQLEIREVEWEHDKAGIGLVRVQRPGSGLARA